MKKFKHNITYIIVCLLLFPMRFLSYKLIHRLGNALGLFIYFSVPHLRNRALANLALARDLQLSNADIKKYAKETFQNFAIICLEFGKLSYEKQISKIATCENPSKALEVLEKNKGVIFFSGHQANWEILFLDVTSRMAGTTVGKPLKNSEIYQKIIKVRERFGGKVVPPENASKEALKVLKDNKFFAIVGDQGMPNSGYISDFLGRICSTSPLPALLSYKTGCPIIVLTSYRKNNHYYIQYSDPIWPDKNQPRDQEIKRLMDKTLSILEESIKENPGQWLWIHNRWKQKVPGTISRKYRLDSIGFILPLDSLEFKEALKILHIFRNIYDKEYFIVMVHKSMASSIKIPVNDI
ncbi:MAG: hypothetical protein EBZ47_04815, partial [Chlamydiae bacterium]|nr:hypothetical protein [Chlamydiota bacterium]